MSSLQHRLADTRPNVHLPSATGETPVSLGEMKHRSFIVVLVAAIVLSMTGWIYALGWVALKLLQLI
jgi:hypothetical protein